MFCEIQLYRQVNYCSVSTIYGVTRKGKDKPFSLVLEFAENGEMIEYFQNSRQTIYIDDFVNIIVQITRLILYLHEEDIFGINISSNILLDKKGRVKLLSLELSNRILKSFQSKNQDIIDFGSIFKVIKFKDREYNKLLKGNEFTYY
ncbi:hypothetical protein RhiirA5_439625 [Rhizophagus irregularis]|uniref:Protein kinase domain-containing protein n=2 Tax=Rhizophagus irregularis TaxID=588596 RepID=A0A2N0NHN5_9GLOM|nr:hypothetical protein RhiirA5_439625 [Rhizophagus irregularis]